MSDKLKKKIHKSGISVGILVGGINYFPVELDAYSPITT
jgi:hypothetical protein